MKCAHCGVELEENMNYCPLCGHPVDKDDVPVHEPVRIEEEQGPHKRYVSVGQLNRPQRRKLLWEVLSLIVLSGVGGVVLLNLIFNQSVTWSVYPLVLGLGLFGYASVFTFWYRKGWRQLMGDMGITFLILFFVDYTDGMLQWAFPVAFPMLLGSLAVGLVLYFIARRTRYYGFNLMAYIFLALAFLVLLLEGVLSFYNSHALHLDWSIIVLISVIPVDAVLLYIHFRLKKNPDLKKFFHI